MSRKQATGFSRSPDVCTNLFAAQRVRSDRSHSVARSVRASRWWSGAASWGSSRPGSCWRCRRAESGTWGVHVLVEWWWMWHVMVKMKPEIWRIAGYIFSFFHMPGKPFWGVTAFLTTTLMWHVEGCGVSHDCSLGTGWAVLSCNPQASSRDLSCRSWIAVVSKSDWPVFPRGWPLAYGLGWMTLKQQGTTKVPKFSRRPQMRSNLDPISTNRSLLIGGGVHFWV